MDRQIPKGGFFFLSRDFSFFFFACKMARGHEEVSTSQVRHRRGTPREKSTTSSLVAAMSTKERLLYSQIPTEIILETSDSATTATIGEAENSVYFTRDQFVAGLRLLVSSLVKQFLHFTWGTSYTRSSERFLDFDGL